MAIMAALCLLLGVALGLRFNVLVLAPAICFVVIGAVVDGLARRNGVWLTVSAMVAVTAAMQLGYCLGAWFHLRIYRHRLARLMAPDPACAHAIRSHVAESWPASPPPPQWPPRQSPRSSRTQMPS
jgi:hypothetical protein